jgi:hypothetical protein
MIEKMKQWLKTYFSNPKHINDTVRWGIIGIILLLLLINTCHKQKTDPQTVTGADSTQYWKDKYGNEHAKMQDLVLERDEMKKNVDSISKILKY